MVEVDEQSKIFADQMGNILVAQLSAVHKILSNDFFVNKNQLSQIGIKNKQAQCIEKMQKVNDFNWQFLIEQTGGRDTPINDMDGMIIGKGMK